MYGFDDINVGDVFYNSKGLTAKVTEVLPNENEFCALVEDFKGELKIRVISRASLINGTFCRGRASKYYKGAKFQTKDGKELIVQKILSSVRRLVTIDGKERVLYVGAIHRMVLSEEHIPKLEIGRELMSNAGKKFVITGKPSKTVRRIRFIESGIEREIHCSSIYKGNVPEVETYVTHKAVVDKTTFEKEFAENTEHCNAIGIKYKVINCTKKYITVEFLRTHSVVTVSQKDAINGNIIDPNDIPYSPGTVGKNKYGDIYGISRVESANKRLVMFINTKHMVMATLHELDCGTVVDYAPNELHKGQCITTKLGKRIIIVGFRPEKKLYKIKYCVSGVIQYVTEGDIYDGNIDDYDDMLLREKMRI